MDKKNIVIFGGSALGDSIVITPFFKNLKVFIPNGNIHYFTGSLIGTKQLQNIPYIDNLHIIKGKKDIKTIFKMIKILLFGKIDYIIFDHSFISFPTILKIFLSNLAIKSKKIAFENKKYSKFFDKTLSRSNENIVKQYGEIISFICNKTINFDDQFEIFIDYKKEEQNIVNIIGKNVNKGEKVIVAHIGGDNVKKGKNGTFMRHRNLGNWIDVFKYLTKQKKSKVFIIGGKDDFLCAEKIKQTIGNGIINLAGKLSLEGSTALINYSDLFISTDSGPMHIAIGLKKKNIALLSSGTHRVDQYISYPIRKDNVKDIEVSDVISIIDKCFLDVQ